MSIPTIRAVFESRLKTWADAQAPVIPVAFQGVGFQKPDKKPFLECFLMPNVVMNRDVSAAHERHLGYFQVNCWAPSGLGMGQAEALAQSVKALFPVVPKTGSVSVETPPKIDKALVDSTEAWVIVPVLITYRYEA